jgi:hypothetical protein
MSDLDGTGGASNVSDLLETGSPRWEAIDFEVNCARCGYNLRMLTVPRCPECGLEFEWTAVLRAHAWRSTFLFEHHWRTKFFRSWFTTVWRSLRPWSFWRQVSIHEHVSPGPLWFMMACSILVFLVALHGIALLGAKLIEVVSSRFWTGNAAPAWLQYAQVFLMDVASTPIDEPLRYYLLLPAGVAVVELAVLGFLCMLQGTLSRARVRPVQILRVLSYSATPFLLMLVLVFFGYCAVITWMSWGGGSGRSEVPSILFMLLVVVLVAMVFSLPGLYIGAGLRQYLRLPRALLIGFTAVFVALLFVAVLWSMLLRLIV